MRASKRDRIITGALELAHRDGFDSLTFDTLAEHVGLSRGVESSITSAPRPSSWRGSRQRSWSGGGLRPWLRWAGPWRRRAGPSASRH